MRERGHPFFLFLFSFLGGGGGGGWGGVVVLDDHVRRCEMISYPLTTPFPNSLKSGEYERR